MDDNINLITLEKKCADEKRSIVLEYYENEYNNCKKLIKSTIEKGLKVCFYSVPLNPPYYIGWNENYKNECCLKLITKLRNAGYKCQFKRPSQIIIAINNIIDDPQLKMYETIKKKLVQEHTNTCAIENEMNNS